ncbi:substrate-binding periplasmic protein [Candidatus Latescibacterota bacterium]
MNLKTITIITAFFVSLAVSLIAYLFFPLPPSPPEPTVYSKIQDRGTIRAAYFVADPLFNIDPNTKIMSGTFYDIVELVAKKLSLKVSWTEEAGYGEMIQGLDSYRYDIVGSGVWVNSGRGKDADFTDPIYYDAVLGYTRPGDIRFDKDISILNSPDYKISTMDGELAATIAAEDFPLAQTEALPQNSDWTQLILNVISGKADIVFLAVAPARSYLAKNPESIREVPNSQLRVFPIAIMLSKGAYELKQSLDYALTEMALNGQVEAILKSNEEKFGYFPGSFIRPSLPYRDTGEQPQ